MEVPKPIVNIPFNMLPEGKDWKVGKAYRVRLVLRQVGMGEDSADFEIIDAISLENLEVSRKYFTTESGVLKR